MKIANIVNKAEIKRSHLIGSIIFTISLVCLGLIIWAASKRGGESEGGKYPLVLLSFDGFRYDYVKRGLSPTLQQIMRDGVSVPFMEASYPTKTFPNHYTIVTGLYPESHGIVANKFYDKAFDAEFALGTEEAMESRWWLGNPIWNTVVQEGKKSAAYFWPGSETLIENTQPSYWFNYSSSTPFEERIDQVLKWLALPDGERPILICAYFNEPDRTGHGYGPHSVNLNASLIVVESIMRRLVDGIDKMGMRDEMNLMVVADHGMAAAGPTRVLHIEDYLPDIDEQASRFFGGATARILINETYLAKKEEMKVNLSCVEPAMRQYEYSELPTRFHFSNSPNRIEDIILDLDAGYVVDLNTDKILEGHHGYDNAFTSMETIFAARGSSFHSDGRVNEPFQNIELYNLMCHVVGVTPLPNNGTEGSLHHLLVHPPPYPAKHEVSLPPSMKFPQDEAILKKRVSNSDCSGDLHQEKDWMHTLNMSAEEEVSAIAYNLPWSLQFGSDSLISTTVGRDVKLLVHPDHVTGYSPSLKQALWTSFTVTGKVDKLGSSEAEWFSDPRLDSSDTITCTEYNNILSKGVKINPLFPPQFSQKSLSQKIPFLVTNSIPMNDQLVSRWAELIELLVDWVALSKSPVNVVAGPVFDNKADSHVDTIDYFGIPPNIPSDLFMVITRCNNSVSDFAECEPFSLEAISFIYPDGKRISNCLSKEVYAREFSARVNDIEIATNLFFYPKLNYEEKVRITTRIYPILWPY